MNGKSQCKIVLTFHSFLFKWISLVLDWFGVFVLNIEIICIQKLYYSHNVNKKKTKLHRINRQFDSGSHKSQTNQKIPNKSKTAAMFCIYTIFWVVCLALMCIWIKFPIYSLSHSTHTWKCIGDHLWVDWRFYNWAIRSIHCWWHYFINSLQSWRSSLFDDQNMFYFF